MVFGESQDGRVGVTDARDTLDILLPPTEAAQVVEHYNRLHDELVRLALAFDAAAPEAFSRHWYG